MPRSLVVGLVSLFVVAGCASGDASRAAPRSSGEPATATIQTLPPSAPAPSATAPLPKDAVRYLALGDSFTIGTGSTPEQAFPMRLKQKLERRGAVIALENLGVNGFTTEDLEQVELPRVADFAPTLVTLAVGANDLVQGATVDEYRARVRRILGELTGKGVAAGRIVCLPQPAWGRSPTGSGFGDPATLEQKIRDFNAAFHEEATRAGAVWADLDQLMKTQAESKMFARDGLHPSAPAHDAWADALVPIVSRVIGGPAKP